MMPLACMREENMTCRNLGLALLVLAVLNCQAMNSANGQDVSKKDEIRSRSVHDEVFYFIMVDRFFNGNPTNDRGSFLAGAKTDEHKAVLQHGYKPDSKAYFHGGDLAGVISKLDYIKGLGVTAIWLSPVMKNLPVQGDGSLAGSSAAYHGYWPVDFTMVDPQYRIYWKSDFSVGNQNIQFRALDS